MKTTLTQDQSSRLIELGVDKKLASAGGFYFDKDGAEIEEFSFTLEDLLSILPKKITDRSRIYELKIWVDHYSDAWCIEYENIHECSDVLDSFQSGQELIDAIYDMIVWLKEENPNLVWL